MQPIRTSALVQAVIDEIGETGTMDVTVSQIARRAGMSSGLVHHYFGSKDNMFIATARSILRKFSDEVRANLQGQADPRERLETIIRTSFSEVNKHPETVGVWLNLYVYAQKSHEVAHLLTIYRARMRSNLLHELRQLRPDQAEVIAEAIAAHIDGTYIRWGLHDAKTRTATPEQNALDSLALLLG
ncbi:transcriptional regulator, TetR family [Cognatishimia maritima]|uniref:HTH-type transcriptional regulator BetI n=2 Tax=Cognatishimia maritima TaxID=870908 RepID=A0A1M5L8V9_9RHOB|nr:transcriptional regulator, TetR family [Cognatishimia maritima]